MNASTKPKGIAAMSRAMIAAIVSPGSVARFVMPGASRRGPLDASAEGSMTQTNAATPTRASQIRLRNR